MQDEVYSEDLLDSHVYIVDLLGHEILLYTYIHIMHMQQLAIAFFMGIQTQPTNSQ